MRFDCLERRLQRVFRAYGGLLSRHPLPFIIVPVLLSAALASGFLYLQRHADVEYLFTSERSRVRHATELMEEFFPSNRSENALYISVIRKGAEGVEDGDGDKVVVKEQEEFRKSIWNRESLEEILSLDRKIRGFGVKSDGRNWTWTDYCERDLTEECPLHPVFQLLNYDPGMLIHVPIYFPVHEIRLPGPMAPIRLFLPNFLGGVTTHPNGTIRTVAAMRLVYTTKVDKSGLDWEDTVRDELLEHAEKEFKHIGLTLLSTRTLDTEITALTQEGLPLMSVLFSVMFTFAVLVSVSADWTVAKPWLAFTGLISASLAIVSAFGLLLFFLPFVDMVTSVPFLALGIGLDDMFVMMASWRKTSGCGDIERRMSAAMSDAAVSITITTLTDLLAIGVGAVTDIPSVRYFCIFAATTVLFDYAYQVTFFAACMSLTGRREIARRHAITFQTIPPKSESRDKSCCFRVWCTGGTSDLHPNAPEDNQEIAAMVFFRDPFGRAIMSIPGKVLVCVLYAAYLGVAIWGCMNLKEGLELTRIVLDHSYANKYFLNWDQYYRQYNEPTYLGIYDKLDYCSKDDRKRISDAIGRFEDHVLFHGADVSEVWTRDFDRYLVARNLTIESKEGFDIILDMFLSEPRYQGYRKDIHKDDTGYITASRFVIYPENLTSPELKMELERVSWEIIESSDLNITIAQQFFVFYESWNVVLPTTLQNFGIAAACVLFVCVLLIPSPICSVYVALSIFSMAVGLVGFMTFFDVNLDSISMIQVIMAVGFSVDFTAHITYAFCVEPGESKNERVRQALYGLGVPIVQGALSTMIAILILASSDAYIFRVFFITLFFTMVFGAMHGLLFIPVVLSIIGPAPKKPHPAEDKNPIEDNSDLTSAPANPSSPAKSSYHDVPMVFWPPMAVQMNQKQSPTSPKYSNGVSWTKGAPVSPEEQEKYIGEKLDHYDQKRCSLYDNHITNYKRGSVTSMGNISESHDQDEVKWSWQEQNKSSNDVQIEKL